ncbi:hypothetical protein PybrP1_004050 [[Pythium] brassicae (nom. inval.)]|nr:hypothetical protein PybrP1_004050 [[Pythium] brassicae (nom. inval.)]
MGSLVVAAVKQQCFVVESVQTKERDVVQGSRLRLYAEPSLEVTDELCDHIATQGLMLGVRAIPCAHYNEPASAWEVKIAWIGLEDGEDSWEPFTSINADVPALDKNFLGTNAADAEAQKLRVELQ